MLRKLLSQIREAISPSANKARFDLAAVGSEAASCPSCNAPLKKFPQRKINCPQCRQPIYSRTRPRDHKKVLLSEAQAALVEEQWAIVNGTIDQLRAQRHRVELVRADLRRKFKREPSANDVQWAVLNQDAIAYSQAGDIGLYRNTRVAMGELLWKEGRQEHALQFFLLVCYLDANGPQNTSGWGVQNPVLFSVKEAFLAPGILGRANQLIQKLNLTEIEARARFMKVTQPYANWPTIPVTPEQAWPTIWAQITAQQAA